MSPVKFECRSIGYECEWALRAASREEVLERVREHSRCAHNLSEIPPEVVGKIESAIQPA